MTYLIKVLLAALVIVAVAEIAKRSTFWAAALASLPLTSLLAFVWMRIDGEPAERIAGLADGIFWLVLPSLFLALPWLLRQGRLSGPACCCLAPSPPRPTP